MEDSPTYGTQPATIESPLREELKMLMREIIDATQRLQPGNVSHSKASVMTVAMYALELLNEKKTKDGL